ncbi:MAG: hypothetical protein HKN19_08180 [Halioglobus sp.]|nr:hypothetical protein [Halioglobus sp.]
MRNIATGLLVLLCCHVGTVSAGIITLDPTYEGGVYWENFTSSGFPGFPSWTVYGISDSHLSMYGAFYNSPPEGTGEIQVQRWLIYDLSTVVSNILNAQLEFDLGASGAGLSSLTVNKLDAFTPGEISTLATGPNTPAQGHSLFNDISSGPLLGNVNLAQGNNTYDVALNINGVELLNQATGLLAFGISHPRGGFYDIDFNSSPRLVLEDDPAQMPLPGTLWMLLLGTSLLWRLALKYAVASDSGFAGADGHRVSGKFTHHERA